MTTSNPLVHLELHTQNLPRACDFYTRLLGWRPEHIAIGSSSYLALGLGTEIDGGVVECSTERSLWLPYAEVSDIEVVTKQARELGGVVLLEPREGPAGWRSVVAAPAGAEIAFWQQKS